MSEMTDEIVPNLVVGQKSDGRSIYSKAAKRALVAICERPGVSVARMALLHRLNANLLRKWITMAGGSKGVVKRAGRRRSAAAVFLPVTTRPEPPQLPEPRQESYLEIRIRAGAIRVRGPIDVAQLRTVIDCLVERG